MDFPEVSGQGRVWQSGTIVTRNDAKVQVAGSGKKLRGLRHGPWRPDLCVLDDIENDDSGARFTNAYWQRGYGYQEGDLSSGDVAAVPPSSTS